MEETGVPGIYYNTYQGCTRYVKFGLFLPKFRIYLKAKINSGSRLWCSTPLSSTFQWYRGGPFCCWRKPGYPEKTSHWQTLSHNVILSTHRMSRMRSHNFSCDHRRSWHGLTTPLFSNFLFTNLFSIKFLYFFISSSLFPMK